MRYLTKREAQSYLNLSYQSVTAWLQEGRLPGAELVDGVWRIPAGTVEAARIERINQLQKQIESISRPVPVTNGQGG